MASLIRVKHNHYWSECFQKVVQMVASICGSGDQCSDKVLRGTMLVDNIFQHIIRRPELHCHKMDKEKFYDLMNLV